LLSGDRVKRERYTAYRLLAKILSEDFGCDCESLALDFEDGGRPYLLKDGGRAEIDFSISHSGELVLVAVSDTVRVGADLQTEVSAALGARLDKRFALSASIATHREKINLYTEKNHIDAAKILAKTSMQIEEATTEFSGELIPSGERTESVPSPISPPFDELGKTVLWATAEAVLKYDGRGFSAYSELGEILPDVSVACASFIYGDKKYAAAICVKV
jgi:hypothetical protein